MCEKVTLLAGLLLVLAFGAHATRAADPATEIRTLVAKGHVEGVFCVAFSPDGKRLASGGDEGEIVLWDTTTWREVRKLDGDSGGKKGHYEDVWGLAFSPDGRRLASASHDETVRIWDVESGKQLLILKGHSFHVWGVAFSPDGTRLASAGGISAGDRFTAGEVRVWDAATGRSLLAMKVPGFRVFAVAFSPDGKRLAAACEDKTLRGWDASTGQEAFTLKGHTDEVNTVAWHPDGKHLASASKDETVRVWDWAGGKEVYALRGYQGAVFSADGKLLAAVGREGVGLWQADTGKEVRRLQHKMGLFWCPASQPNGKQLAWAAGIREIKVWTVDGVTPQAGGKPML